MFCSLKGMDYHATDSVRYSTGIADKKQALLDVQEFGSVATAIKGWPEFSESLDHTQSYCAELVSRLIPTFSVMCNEGGGH